jgi:hypothetical protein
MEICSAVLVHSTFRPTVRRAPRPTRALAAVRRRRPRLKAYAPYCGEDTEATTR